MTRNTWSILFEAHRKRRGITQSDAAIFMRVTQAAVSDYERGVALPPLQQLSDIANALELTGTERVSFIEEGYLVHAPDRIRIMVDDLRRRVGQLEKAIGRLGHDPNKL